MKELNEWKPIDENNYLIMVCKWHDDAGFCVDELRCPTHWQELPSMNK